MFKAFCIFCLAIVVWLVLSWATVLAALSPWLVKLGPQFARLLALLQ